MIWTDCITNLRLKESNNKDWKFKSMLAMCLAMTSNLAFLLSILQRNILRHYYLSINIDFGSKYLNNVINFLALYTLPCLLVNYLLIFRNERYVKILKKYPYKKGKLFAGYFILSLSLPIVLLWIGIIYFRS